MTIYYLSSVDGSDASDGLSWDNAFATFKYAVETASAAASGPHLLYVDSAHSESLSGAIIVTLAGNLRILCVNRSTGALATTAAIGVQASNYGITIAGAYILYCYGLIFKPGTGGSSTTLIFGSTVGCHFEMWSCQFVLSTGPSSGLGFGHGGSTAKGYIRLNDCTIKLGATGQTVNFGASCYTDVINCTLDPSGTSPTALINPSGPGDRTFFEGCDFSHVGANTLVKDQIVGAIKNLIFSNCKFGSGMTIKAAASSVLNKGQSSVWAFNCDAGDTHYSMYHGDAFGETTVSTSIYANDGASYDGSNRCSWKIVTTANCSYYTPYVSPWMDVYHDGTTAITPYLECLRSGSTTAYYNDEVWTEWSYQGTTDSTKSTIDNSDRMTPLGSRAAQTSSNKTAADWTGEDVSNNWFGKLGPTSAITPLERGHIRARICVGLTSTTVYVDPTIRGIS